MAHFADIETAIVEASLEFVETAENIIHQFQCVNGEIAGFRLRKLPVLGSEFMISQIYNCSTGTPILQGTVSVVPGMDLTGGLFSSGCIPDGDPFDISTKFYKVNYA